jgi:hypothetical protein
MSPSLKSTQTGLVRALLDITTSANPLSAKPTRRDFAAFTCMADAAEALVGYLGTGELSWLDNPETELRGDLSHPLGDFGGEFGIEFGQFFLLLGRYFGGGRRFAQPFHGQFVGTFHRVISEFTLLASSSRAFPET